ncbi:MAG: hypothetical protein Q9197_003370 [Variospora fuerteventurae]
MVRLQEIPRTATFHDIAWAEPDDNHPQGLLAGALENGSLDLWSAEKLLNSQEDGFLSRTSKHSGPIKALQFNSFRHGLLASAGVKGELFISDLNNIANPYRMGNSVARADDFECLDWNKNVPHITVTGSSGGFVTVWDVKTKKESLTLNNMGRKAVSAVAWDPKKHTRLVTAIPLDTDPLILVWDLRNANAPERVLRGHDGGVLSLSWCPHDNDLLISCGKDNRTICWNPQTGEAYGEFPVVTNWTFQTRWNPHNPSFLATASFDGKITVHPLQSTKADARQSNGDPAKSMDDGEFFNTPQTESQMNSFSLPKPPKWLQKPCGATFGFGGKVVSFNAIGSGAHAGSKVRISSFTIDAGIGESTVTFENEVQGKDLLIICQRQLSEELEDSEIADWKTIETLTSPNPRQELVKYLGFSTAEDQAADGLAKLTVNGGEGQGSPSEKPSGITAARQNRLSAFFENSAEGDGFLSDLAATKGAQINNPFQVYSGSESEPDRKITRALLLGQFDRALEICLQEDRLSDAFMVAICGGQSCIQKAQKAYFSRKTGGPNYLRLLASVVGKNLWDIVYNADLANWSEVMATLCTYATAEEFPDLCEALGDRLDELAKSKAIVGTLRQDACFCYLAGSKLEKVVGIWIAQLEQRETSESQKTSNDSSFGIHARLLQQFIQKVTVFREAANFQDQDLQATSNWKLGLLYDKYTEYADLVASFGQLQIAERYLGLLPAQYPAAEAAKERIKQATRGPSQQPAPKQTPLRNPATAAPTRVESQQARVGPPQNPPNPYAPPSALQAQNHPQPIQTSYKPAGYSDSPKYEPNQTVRQSTMPLQEQAPPHQNPSLGPPPRAINVSPSIPAPSKANNMGNWNDMPESFFKPPTSRRGTPGVLSQSANSSYGYPPSGGLGVPPPALGGQQKWNSPLPPPPKGLPRTSSPMTSAPSTQPQDRPSSAAANAYAPQKPGDPMTHSQQPPIIHRGASPYNAPPSAVPPSNRYAPIADSPKEVYPPPGTNRTAPPPNPYTPQPNYSSVQQRAPSERVQASSMPPPSGPPPKSSGPPLAATVITRPEVAQYQPGREMSSATPSKHPLGDRGHIPAHSRPIFELLSTDMQRVKARAPANFQKQVVDTEKRLNILFDHLNNQDLLKEDTVASMVQLSQALQARDYERAQGIHLDLLTNKTDQCGQWMLVATTAILAMEDPQPSEPVPSDESPTQKQARLRRERREAKIKAGGSARLDKITQLSGRPAEAVPFAPQAHVTALSSNADPEEGNISDHQYPAQIFDRSEAPTEAHIRQLLRSAPSTQNAKDGLRQQPAEGQDGQMVQLLQQMIGGMSGAQDGRQAGSSSGLDTLLGGDGASRPVMPGQGQRDEGPDTSAYLWKVTHTVFASMLAVYMTAVTTFSGAHISRAGTAPSSAEGEVGKRLFWTFAILQMVLQGSRFFLENGKMNQSGWMSMLMQLLPEPWKNYAGLVVRYSGIWTTVVEDAMVVVFVLGFVAWWKGATG